MRTNKTLRSAVFTIFLLNISSTLYSQASCVAAVTLTPSAACNTVSGDLQGAVNAAPTGACGGATSTTTKGVWFNFTATSSKATITLSNLGSNLTAATTYIELLNGTCPSSFTSMACQNASTPLTTTSLTPGTIYYIRVYVTGTTTGSPTNRRGFDICLQSSPNDECSNSILLNPGSSCTSTAGTLDFTTATTGLAAGCESAGTHYDVWYSFVAASTTHTVTLSSIVAISNPEIQLYRGSCGALVSVQCGTNSLTATGLTIGNTYYVRVSNIGSSPTGSSFNICVTYPPSNDDCANTINLYSNTTCTNTSATLGSATPSAGIPLGCAVAGTYYDVWFTFAAANSSETITLSSMTGIASPRIQLYSGSCGSLTSVACSATSSLAVSGLSVGTTYYIRVSNYNTAATSTGNFNICITHPAPAASITDYGKSYVNISKNSGGGTINPGDTLEIRATFVIKTGAAAQDSLAFLDTLHLSGGVRLVPGSIALRTNEGKVYKGFTDAIPDDAGYYYTSGTDTVIRINFGTGSSASARGRLTNTSKPSVFGSTCIIMATYRVVVYANYGTTLNLGGGKITAKDATTGILSNLSFSARNAIVYSSPGLCPNAVSASNAIGGDNNGTFGSGTPQNRAPSPNVNGYTYATFTTGNPQDYFYGVANNTSAGGTSFTSSTTWQKPDPSTPTHRVFNLWDISGDHTGAANPLKGNLPCDPTQPVSATNPCGYMLVVNSAYKTDTAFQYTVSNLCPNTHYEISAWFKNICYKCGCDSNGASSTTAGYLPSGPNDSSGVQPNITFDINGTDYYTTGNIVYGGLFPSTQTGSDSNNTWAKRGFTYLTGPSQNSLTLTIRNNAPGGGGNDWAMDDVALATCLPNMQYSPSLSPSTCNNNVLVINDTIRSYFNTYSNYKWQRSIDAGSTWSDIALATGSASPAWNGSAYQYITSYTIPPTATNVSDSGDKYRVVVGTTVGSLSDANCQVTDGVSQISLTVVDCGIPLGIDILSFNGKELNGHANLYWTTNKETEPIQFEVEKSLDGINFTKIAFIMGRQSTSETNQYSFTDSMFSTKTFYRISLINKRTHRTYSRIIQLLNNNEFSVSNVTSYFHSAISFDVSVNRYSKIDLVLLNSSGNIMKSTTMTAYNGTNNFVIPNLASLTQGVYVLQVRNNEKTFTVKAVKK
jgi:trimeric autotransporter adhesin